MILCYHGDTSVIAADGNRQSIFSSDDGILATENNRTISTLQKNKDVLGLESILCFSDRAVMTKKKSREFQGLNSRHRGMPSTEQLCDITYFLFTKLRPTQLGFIDKTGSKILYSPHVELIRPPDEYNKRGALSFDLHRVNSEFYNVMIRQLDLIAEADKPGLRNTLRKRKLRNGLADMIDRYLHYHHGPIERHSTRRYLDKKSITQARNHNLSNRTLQKKLDAAFLPRGVGSLILKMGYISEFSKRIFDFSHKLEQETGLFVRPFMNFRYVAVKGDSKDIKNFAGKAGKATFFSPKNRFYMRQVRDVTPCYGKYTPELIEVFCKDRLPRKVTPISTRKNLWNLENIGAYEAQDITDGSGLNCAIVDTGVDYNHVELKNNFTRNLGYDFVRNCNDPMDFEGHGTHVAGTVAGTGTGVAPGATLYAVRVLNENGSGSLDDVLLGIDWCITNKMDIMNFSLGSPDSSEVEMDIFYSAYSMGILSVAAAGNEYFGASYPAAYDTVISVAAVDKNNKHADFSNIWKTNNVSAPGVGILSAFPGNDYASLTGTSMATPHITGCAALAGSSGKGISKEDFIYLLEATSLPLGKPGDADNWAKYGCGLVQAQKMVKYGESFWKKLIA